MEQTTMLRRNSRQAESERSETSRVVSYPPADEPFILGHSPAGIHFYRPKEAFYLPYSTLHAMRLSEDMLTLIFATDDVIVEGRGLHSLYAHIADQKVKRVHEQSARFEEGSDASIFIRRIQRRARAQ